MPQASSLFLVLYHLLLERLPNLCQRTQVLQQSALVSLSLSLWSFSGLFFQEFEKRAKESTGGDVHWKGNTVSLVGAERIQEEDFSCQVIRCSLPAKVTRTTTQRTVQGDETLLWLTLFYGTLFCPLCCCCCCCFRKRDTLESLIQRETLIALLFGKDDFFSRENFSLKKQSRKQLNTHL